VLKSATAKIAIEPLFPPAGNEEIITAIAVVIAHRGAHGVGRTRSAGGGGEICERSIALVAIEATGWVGSITLGSDRTSIAKVDIEPTITVGIDQSHATPHDLRKVVSTARTGLKPKRNSRFTGDVPEPDGRFRRE